jgi:hypothetical protein
MTGAFIPLVVASVAAVGAIVYGFARRFSGTKTKNDGGNFKSDGQANDTTSDRF